MSWAQLPLEIVLQIIDILDVDLIQFRLVCQTWFRHTYGFLYKQFRVTSNVIDFVNALATLPYRPGELVKKITFSDEFVEVDLDGQLATIVKSIFHYCPNLELIYYSTLARSLIWPCIIEEANHIKCLRKVKYLGDHIFPELCKTEEETELLYVHVMYALTNSISSLYLFNDDPRSLFPVYEAFKKRLKHFKALEMLHLHGCFTLEELNTTMDDCQIMTTLVIYSAIDSSCLYRPMLAGHIKPHTQLKYLQVHSCSLLEIVLACHFKT
ncbi:uncharacterized protein B0P05DRAFT_583035 [Gilbertella persicaria]|uniref:uncharacterized protein n=1 Tax=Gilbertella persicaria TaxID=101096 RepID=UPI0022208B8D|nr:uncharacterized protein B0P05DRAFT_583035 [Gilbertella persicaria]KAI8098063.1 hypothetical protein B0P05DRAFT_583035 [Gilbertella persicaria]